LVSGGRRGGIAAVDGVMLPMPLDGATRTGASVVWPREEASVSAGIVVSSKRGELPSPSPLRLASWDSSNDSVGARFDPGLLLTSSALACVSSSCNSATLVSGSMSVVGVAAIDVAMSIILSRSLDGAARRAVPVVLPRDAEEASRWVSIGAVDSIKSGELPLPMRLLLVASWAGAGINSLGGERGSSSVMLLVMPLLISSVTSSVLLASVSSSCNSTCSCWIVDDNKGGVATAGLEDLEALPVLLVRGVSVVQSLGESWLGTDSQSRLLSAVISPEGSGVVVVDIVIVLSIFVVVVAVAEPSVDDETAVVVVGMGGVVPSGLGAQSSEGSVLASVLVLSKGERPRSTRRGVRVVEFVVRLGLIDRDSRRCSSLAVVLASLLLLSTVEEVAVVVVGAVVHRSGLNDRTRCFPRRSGVRGEVGTFHSVSVRF